ncbi:putative F-box domain-containing protein [Medicago truncatula]|uniref:F-box protein interaction domain protein n=1 Tax=Medicago truncatula TaxID=3880 RepID=G7K4T0_MEDTR|nr:F-box protein CPR1 [Medicago truncatula]AET00850.2 F-box protein interaction domain protein [Medicago truncatula]RHN58062.1 putative F-box domain-containing protein [Medicago truncatula]
MDNSLAIAVIDEKVWINLPHDLVLFILSKLPLKSLKRFICVCKSWSLLFENPNFIKMYCNNILCNDHSDYDDTFLILHKLPFNYYHGQHCEFYLLSSERLENRVKLDWPPQFQEIDTNIYVVGCVSINGILCLKQGFKYTRQVVLWNPTTRESKVIPPSPVENIRPNRTPFFFLHGFGYDHVSDDYKVVQMIDYFPDNDPDDEEDLIWEDRSYDPLWEIYSLKSNSWKKLEFDMRNCYYYTPLRGIGLYTDGMFHWWAKSESKNIEECLLSFDFSNEELFKTPIPSNMDGNFNVEFVERHLALLNGTITLISSYREEATFRLSILGKLGVRESWINLFIVGPFHEQFGSSFPFFVSPIGLGKKNNIVFLNKRDNKIVWVDLKTQMIEELGVEGDKFRCHIGKYKKSFLPIEGINT